jgi:hypothetical protein
MKIGGLLRSYPFYGFLFAKQDDDPEYDEGSRENKNQASQGSPILFG